MRVVGSCEDIGTSHWPVVTLGMFDGVHLGHRAVLAEVLRRSRMRDGTALVVTFDPHPRKILQPGADIRLLTTRREKLLWLERLGFATVVILPFTERLANTPPEVFLEETVLQGCGAKEVVIGYDHGFGRDRAGSLNLLLDLAEKHHFAVTQVPDVAVEGWPVSSTRARETVVNGHMEAAARLLGHCFSIVGKVVKGDGRGRQIGFPTINIDVEPEKLLPKDGVYAVWVRHAADGESPVVSTGAMNIGIRPTVGGIGRTIECHLLDFDGNLYGSEVEVCVVERLRDEDKFCSQQDLSNQIGNDLKMTRNILQDRRVSLWL